MNVLLCTSDERSRMFTLQKFDKEEGPFICIYYIQYINFSSNRPNKHAYNVIVSQTVPTLYFSNDITLVLREIML